MALVTVVGEDGADIAVEFDGGGANICRSEAEKQDQVDGRICGKLHRVCYLAQRKRDLQCWRKVRVCLQSATNSQGMRRRTKIILSAVMVTAVVLALWMGLSRKEPVTDVVMVISTNAPKAYHSFFTAFLTNNTASLIVLDPPIVQLEEESGFVLNNAAEIWVDASGKQMFTIPPNGVIFNSPQTDRSYRRLRVIVQYSCKANVLARFFSLGLRKMNLSFLPTRFRNWMFDHGYVDGGMHGKLVSDWMVNPSFRPDHERTKPASLE